VALAIIAINHFSLNYSGSTGVSAQKTDKLIKEGTKKAADVAGKMAPKEGLSSAVKGASQKMADAS
jgi:hypothetical protein